MPELNGASEKLQPEVDAPASRTGTGWIATASVFVSVAAVLVPASIGFLGWMNTRDSQAYEHEKTEREFRLNCVQSGATVAKIAFDLAKDFKDMPDDEKINQINIIIASFPPDTARRFLGALGPRIGSNPEVIRAIQVAVHNSDTSAEEKGVACAAGTDLISTPQLTARTTAEPGPPTPTQPLQPTPSATSQPAGKQKLAVYYQITGPADRDYANRLAKDIDEASTGLEAKTAFPAAGVELVPAAALAQTEIRYYRQDQAKAATELKELLEEKARNDQLPLSGKIVYIGNRFPNLPPGRIEVWFQPLVGYVALGRFENKTYRNFRVVSSVSDDGLARVGDIVKANQSVNLRSNTENTESGTNSPLGTIPEGGCAKILERYDNIRGQTWAAVKLTACS